MASSSVDGLLDLPSDTNKCRCEIHRHLVQVLSISSKPLPCYVVVLVGQG